MLETRKDLKERITAQDAQIADLEAEIVEAASKVEAAEAAAQVAATENAEQAETIATLEGERDELTAKVAEFESAAEADAETIVELEEAAEVTEQKVAEEAAEQLATVGHPPVEVDDASPDVGASADAIREEFAKMPAGEERSAFYAKHRDLLAR